MSLKFIQGDITTIGTEAIVNAANNSLLGGGGVDGAIHVAAGYELFLECLTLNGCETGKSKITKGYNLKSKYIIHTVGPVYYDGKRGEEKLLTSCMESVFELVDEYKIKSIAFPLISTGAYSYPLLDATKVIVDQIKLYLTHSDIDVIIVVFSDFDFKILKNHFNDIPFISNNPSRDN
jgi:O-acetyl-ADP-ribose deacetylase (regulator of RNase III)